MVSFSRLPSDYMHEYSCAHAFLTLNTLRQLQNQKHPGYCSDDHFFCPLTVLVSRAVRVPTANSAPRRQMFFQENIRYEL